MRTSTATEPESQTATELEAAAGAALPHPQTPPARRGAGHPRALPKGRVWLRRMHALVGVVLSLNILVILLTGFLIQHRDFFRLDERYVSRRFLPGSYRMQDGPDGVRTDIVVTDLHSGRMFGAGGALVVDALALAWFALLGTGLVMYALGRLRHENGVWQNGDHET